MRKLLLIFLLLFSLNVYAGQSIQPVITSGTVAANGILISAVNGTAFIDVDTSKTGASDFSTAILAAVANNDYIVIQSKTSGQVIAGFAKAAGSGTLGTDNLGSEAITSWTNRTETLAYETLTVNGNGHDIDALVNSSDSGVAYTNAAAIQYGLTKIVITPTITSGDSPTLNEALSSNGNIGKRIATVPDGTYYYIYNQTYSGRSLALYNNNTNVNGSFAVSLKPVTAPSSAGITITNSPGGSTYNFSLLPVETTTFYNDAAGYTYRIISRHYYGSLIASASVDDDDTTIVTTDGSAACDLSTTLNLTAYVGASGATKYWLVLEDDAGKIARGYVGEVISGTNMKIYSAKNGSTQNWELIESGFNTSADPMKARIYRAL